MVTEQLLSEIEAGQGESLSRAARRIPSARNNRPATMSRILRWVLAGTIGPNGERVRLEAVKSPSGWLTTPAAIGRYLARMTPRLEDEPAPLPRTPTARRKASERAAARLEQLGI